MISVFAALILISADTPVCAPGHPTLVESWQIDGFSNPESVLGLGDGSYLVSNVAGNAGDHDGEGFISRVWAQGGLNEFRWADGLDAPKGMARTGDRVFVTDIDRLVEINLLSGDIIARHPIEGAQFLNDAAALEDGRILISDSRAGRIYIFDGDGADIWMEDHHFAGLNGLQVEPDQLIVTTMRDGYVLAIDRRSQAITVLAEGMSNLDGVARWCAGYLVSQWPGEISYLHDDGRVRQLLDTRDAGIAMNDFIIDGDMLLVPNWTPGTLRAYQLQPLPR